MTSTIRIENGSITDWSSKKQKQKQNNLPTPKKPTTNSLLNLLGSMK